MCGCERSSRCDHKRSGRNVLYELAQSQPNTKQQQRSEQSGSHGDPLFLKDNIGLTPCLARCLSPRHTRHRTSPRMIIKRKWVCGYGSTVHSIGRSTSVGGLFGSEEDSLSSNVCRMMHDACVVSYAHCAHCSSARSPLPSESYR